MIKYILPVIIFFGVSQLSFAKKEDSFYNDGQAQFVYSYKDNKLHGITREYYPSGELKVESSYEEGQLLNEKYYRLDGQIEYNLIIKDGVRYETLRKFHPSGKLFRKRHLVNGKQSGLEKEYYPTGKIKAERTYKNGKKQGMAKGYYDNGQVQGAWEFDKGVPVAATIFYPSGEKHLVHEFKNGRIHGITKEYDKKGRLKARRHYKNDRLIKRVRK